jgi:nucleobase:cation symporter-1, NCS1 family
VIGNAKSGGRKRRMGFADSYPNMTTVEKRGIEHIPIENRWGTPGDLFWMWAGAIWNIAFVLYGGLAVLVFGLSFIQAVVVILLGNMFYLLTGFASLQGPYAGTTTFAISRAAFGPRGNKIPAMFNWATLVGFEIITVTVIVLAAIAFGVRAGFRAGRPAELTFTVVAVAIQAILPVLGHSAILRVLRLLAIPFAILFVIMAAITAAKMNLNSGHSRAGWARC